MISNHAWSASIIKMKRAFLKSSLYYIERNNIILEDRGGMQEHWDWIDYS
jgi:hypothetical protein